MSGDEFDFDTYGSGASFANTSAAADIEAVKAAMKKAMVLPPVPSESAFLISLEQFHKVRMQFPETERELQFSKYNDDLKFRVMSFWNIPIIINPYPMIATACYEPPLPPRVIPGGVAALVAVGIVLAAILWAVL